MVFWENPNKVFPQCLSEGWLSKMVQTYGAKPECYACIRGEVIQWIANISIQTAPKIVASQCPKGEEIN